LRWSLQVRDHQVGALSAYARSSNESRGVVSVDVGVTVQITLRRKCPSVRPEVGEKTSCVLKAYPAILIEVARAARIRPVHGLKRKDISFAHVVALTDERIVVG
jgi:hypothetical protein